VESPLLLARIRARLQASPPEMLRKAVARECPLLGYLCWEDSETLESGPREPFFRSV
jgi:hypothetical protein